MFGVPPAIAQPWASPVQPFDAVLLRVPVTAMQLHGHVGYPLRHLVSGALG